MDYIFRSTGQYIGYINQGNLFSRDNAYLGWIDRDNVWDGNTGEFRGKVISINNNKYIIKNRFVVNPIPRVLKIEPIPPVLPAPPANINPILLPVGIEDSF